MNTNSRKNIRYTIEVAVFTSLIVVFSYIRIPLGESFVHLGNGMCLLAGLLISPVAGGLASGFGSVIFDVLGHPSTFVFEFLITFITKFLMGFSCGVLFKLFKRTGNTISLLASSIFGEIVYIVCYLIKSYFVQLYIVGIHKDVIGEVLVSKLVASSINAVFAIIFVMVFYNVILRVRKMST